MARHLHAALLRTYNDIFLIRKFKKTYQGYADPAVQLPVRRSDRPDNDSVHFPALKAIDDIGEKFSKYVDF